MSSASLAADPATVPETVMEDARRALTEDLGSGDVTAALVPVGRGSEACIVSREAGVLCGAPWAEASFTCVDRAVRVQWLAADGDRLAPDEEIARILGPSRAILTAERTALNFLQLLSGTATLTRAYVDAIEGTSCTLLDTRKTVPGLRAAQKYAVRCGGGHNHRLGLYDAVLIKENHLAALGGVGPALAAARRCSGELPVELEVETLAQLEAALEAGAERLLLDNFTLDELDHAVEAAHEWRRKTGGEVLLEASGGITLNNVGKIASTGVDFVSVGALTKHVRSIDLSLRFSR
ncbi:carboxylating nicotinate-nucleotide diphosphorylase [soil metagenome]